MVAPDATTVDYLRGRPEAPQGEAFEREAARWLALASDPDARYDRELRIDAATIAPTVTWGTDPGKALAIDARVPMAGDAASRKALDYMRLSEGQAIAGTPVDVVFVGSCTNSRLSDLRAAAAVLRGRRVDPRVRMLVVPGSERVKREAEAEGLHEVFRAAGADWREPGCSMCIGMNGDIARPGELVVSTSNRNFEGRQGKGVRTVLASPATAAASAVRGVIADPRALTADGATA
jgi:3-isopropylmalate/(R)-2-methylmalate dehydratase large subunit